MSLTGGVGHLVLAVAAFVAAHSLTSLRPLRHAIEARLGRRGFTIAYSILSTALLVWVVAAALDAPTIVLWTQEPWMRWAPVSAMCIACPLLVVGLATPNPFSLGAAAKRFDPARPGILRLTRHPAIWALALWSGAHLLPNGTLGGVVLFAPLFIMSVLGPRVLDRKRRQSLGLEEWRKLAQPLAGPIDWRAMAAEIGLIKPVAGLALVGVLMALHPLVIGRSPYP
jgi:uncharacterized membrane protein